MMGQWFLDRSPASFRFRPEGLIMARSLLRLHCYACALSVFALCLGGEAAAKNPVTGLLPLEGDKPRLLLNEKGPALSAFCLSPDGKTLAAVVEKRKCIVL